jgi:hypothetical protein
MCALLVDRLANTESDDFTFQGRVMTTTHFYFEGKKDHFYYGLEGPPKPGPQAYLVELASDIHVAAHFHDTNQFQVFYGSPGATFQRHEIESLVVHYADAYTVYGPFAAGGEPLRFFTLRQQHATGEYHLPDHRDLLEPGQPRRHHEWVLSRWLAAPMPGPGELVLESLCDEPDGLGASTLLAGPEAEIVWPDSEVAGGRYCVVISGDVVCQGDALPAQSVVWCEPGSDPSALRVGSLGARVLALQFGPTRKRVKE